MLPFARSRYGERLDIPRFEKGVALAQERATTLVQIADQIAFLFTPDDDFTISDEHWEKLASTDRAAEILDADRVRRGMRVGHDAIDSRSPIR